MIILPLAAWLGMRFGKKRYFVLSLGAFTAASVLCGVATSIGVESTARQAYELGFNITLPSTP